MLWRDQYWPLEAMNIDAQVLTYFAGVAVRVAWIGTRSTVGRAWGHGRVSVPPYDW